jgi:hypothetical protein
MKACGSHPVCSGRTCPLSIGPRRFTHGPHVRGYAAWFAGLCIAEWNKLLRQNKLLT